MDRGIIVAKIKRQRAEIEEILAEIRDDHSLNDVKKALKYRIKKTKKMLEALEDKSVIPRGYEELDIEPDIRTHEKKVKKVKIGIEKIKRLEEKKKRAKEKIIKEIKKE